MNKRNFWLLLGAIIISIIVNPTAFAYTSASYEVDEIDQVDGEQMHSASYSTSLFDENAIKLSSASYQNDVGVVYLLDDSNAPWLSKLYPLIDVLDNTNQNPTASVKIRDNETPIFGCIVQVYINGVLKTTIYGADLNADDYCSYTFTGSNTLYENDQGFVVFIGIDWMGNASSPLTTGSFYYDLEATDSGGYTPSPYTPPDIDPFTILNLDLNKTIKIPSPASDTGLYKITIRNNYPDKSIRVKMSISNEIGQSIVPYLNFEKDFNVIEFAAGETRELDMVLHPIKLSQERGTIRFSAEDQEETIDVKLERTLPPKPPGVDLVIPGFVCVIIVIIVYYRKKLSGFSGESK